MRKRLLMIAAFALTMVGTVSAYNVGDYAYNSTQRFKITGENLVTNGDFANGTQGWCGATADDPADSDTWEKVDGGGPNGKNAMKSLAATADKPLCKSWQLEAGTTYIVSIDVKFPTTLYTAPITGGSAAGNNSVDFFLNTNGSFTKAASTEDAPVTNVASSSFCVAEEWTTLVYSFTPAENTTNLVMRLEKLPAEAMVTNIAIHAAAKVYDIRLAQARFAYARTLMADENFTATDDAKAAKETLEGTIATLEEMIGKGEFDDPGEAEPMMEAFENEYFAPFLDASTENLTNTTYFPNIDIVSIPKYNRGSAQTANGATLGGFKFYGDHWWHGNKQDYLHRFILPGANNHIAPGGITLINDKLPAGKYFLSFEVRNGTCLSNWFYDWTYNEGDFSAFLNKDTGNRTVLGKAGKTEGWTRFYIIDELKEGETFEAGFWWDVPDENPCHGMDVRNFEVRSFGSVADRVARLAAWDIFIVQYNAMIAAKKKLEEMLVDKNYPWAKDSLQKAKDLWGPFYDRMIAKGWVTAEGKDAGSDVVTTEELTEWATTGWGFEEQAYSDKYALIRCFQHATDYVINENKAITDVKAEIEIAEALRDDPMNSNGDKNTFQTAIDAAKAVVNDVLADADDASREADEATLATALDNLKAAETTFKASAELKPIINIDFANKAELKTATDETQYYSIAGTTGEMTFTESIFNTDNTQSDNWLFQQGYGEELLDVLHIGGNGYGIVTLAESDIPTDNDVLRVQYDVWYGNLGKAYLTVDLLNAADEVVAGTSLCRYDGSVGYNDFNDDNGTGMDLKQAPGQGSSTVGNVGICIDNNRSGFDLIIDYKAKAVQGALSVNGVKKSEGGLVPMKELADNKIVKFRVGSTTYQKANATAHARRCWFDNLVIYKYASQAEGPITAIENVETVKANDGVIYNLAGQKVSKSFKGLIIKNGKKYFVK